MIVKRYENIRRRVDLAGLQIWLEMSAAENSRAGGRIGFTAFPDPRIVAADRCAAVQPVLAAELHAPERCQHYVTAFVTFLYS